MNEAKDPRFKERFDISEKDMITEEEMEEFIIEDKEFKQSLLQENLTDHPQYMEALISSQDLGDIDEKAIAESYRPEWDEDDDELYDEEVTDFNSI